MGADTVRLSIDCSKLRRCSSPVSTADNNVYPYELPNIDLIFKVQHGWFNHKNGLAEVHLDKIHCMPPETLPEGVERCPEIASTLLGMDVLNLFKKWKLDDKNMILET